MTRVLVTGAGGFIASHAVERLLARGDEVVGTVRDPSDARKTAHLRSLTGADERLTLVKADLRDAEPFTAHADVDAILHMASPYAIAVKDPQRDLVSPAVAGTLAALRAARANPRVRRVVLTSSVAAITDEPDGRVLTEADWNDKSSFTRNPYHYSKVLAERAAWDFMRTEKPRFDLVVINPFIVIGPSHTEAVNTSNRILVDLVEGTTPAVMALEWGFVDVRDVAEAHLRAMAAPEASGRYICASGAMTMREVVRLARELGFGRKLPRLSLEGAMGTRLAKLLSYTQPAGVGSYLRTHLGRSVRFDNARIRRELGMTFRPPAESVRDTLFDLARWGHVPPPAQAEARGTD